MNDEDQLVIDFKPSQVLLTAQPLTATMGKSEIEYAAALIVRVCQVNGDRWQPITTEMLVATVHSDLDEKQTRRTRPRALQRNQQRGAHPSAQRFQPLRGPFFRPDVHATVSVASVTL